MSAPRSLPAHGLEAWGRFVRWFNGLDLSENGVLLSFGVAIGVLGALAVAAFYGLVDLAYRLLYGLDLLAERGPAFHLPLITAVALLAAWWIMRRLGRGHDGLNIPDVQLAVARRGGAIPTGPSMARAAASAVTIGGGGSAGSEGPVAVLGATLGSFLGRTFRFDASRVRVLVAAGAAAGISAAFGTPLAGAFFALEQILGSLAVTAFPPVVVSSVVASVVSHSLLETPPAFPAPPQHAAAEVADIALLYPLLGVVAGLAGVAFIRVYYGTQGAVRRSGLPAPAVAIIGGALVGGMVALSGGVLGGGGHTTVPLPLFAGAAWWILALLAFGKILATAITLSAGGSGGVFTPCLVVGASLGGAFGLLADRLVPGLAGDPVAYALVGMGAVVVAATDAPLTGILIVYELTNDYAIVPPLMLTTVVAHLVARHVQADSLYTVWLRRRGEDIREGTDQDVLRRLRVRDAFQEDPAVIGEAATVSQLLEHLGPGAQTAFPVVDEDLRPVGMISVNELGRIARDEKHLLSILLATDVAIPVPPVTPGDDLLETIKRMGTRGMATLPVVDPQTGRLAGIIDRGHVLAAYERQVAGEPEADDADPDSQAAVSPP
ncbi:MAG: chloride channel protein [Gemmatimonadetes bacterium]|nr:chloride channel protein [Gemmatimonadota bacterium]